MTTAKRLFLGVMMFAAVIPACATQRAPAAPPATPANAQRPTDDQPSPSDRVRVLFLGDNGHHRPHDRAKGILPILAQRGIDLYYTDEREDLNPEELDKYHVLMLYNNHTTVSPQQLNALTEFVKDGGGLVVLHCASASFQNSEEFIRLVGASFLSHGTGTFGVTRTQANHPAIQGVPAFTTWDETYIHTKHNPVGRTVLEVRSADGHDEPWTWVKNYGEGRVYYTAWGHDQRTWGQPGFQDQVTRAAKWAAGDWALNQRLTEPQPVMMDLEVPIPTYRRDSLDAQGRVVWNVPGPPVTRAPQAMATEDMLALTTFRPGFKAVPFAVEPLIGNIIDFTWDASGRMWAIETNDYPNDVIPDSIVVPSPGPYPGAKDRIIIIEDTNNDGTADGVKVFAEGLNLATSLVLANGGVIVGQAPHMLFFKDTNGDEKADERTILFTGWPRTDTHGTISNLRWGFDNQILGSVGYNGFRGTVGNTTIARQGVGSMGAGYYRFPANASSLDYIARTSNNTWGVALTEDNIVTGSTANSVPSNVAIIPARYYVAAGLREPTIGASTPQAGPPSSPTHRIFDRNDVYAIREIWQVDQFDRYTAGAGHEIYTARLFPQEYWNRVAFVAEPTAHVLGMFEMLPNGSTYTMKNQWNFFASRDPWVAPVQMKVGPDGALWVSDFYTLIAQHNPVPRCCGFRNGPGQAYETPNRDKLHGRIYRVLPENAQVGARVNLSNATPAQLVQQLRSDNMWWRLKAQQMLVEGRHTNAAPQLITLVNDQMVDAQGLNVGALHGLWTLHGLGLIPANAQALAAARSALHHPAASVRRAAIQVLPRTEQTLNDLFAAGFFPDRNLPANMQLNPSTGVMQDADPKVRVESILALMELPANQRTSAALVEMLYFPANARDIWLPDAIALAGTTQGPDFGAAILTRRLPNNADSLTINGIRNAARLLAQHYVATTDVPATVALLAATPQANPQIALSVVTAIAPVPPPQGQQGGGGGQGQGGGWPQDATPTLTPEQKTALVTAFRAASPELQQALQRVADRWGQPDMFK